ncbi:MAG: hypothetical protein HY548_03020, partial [Elusimicrobia bacterium]|nr:hypothetical protein [Elusimicrobiota bacterium]
SNPPIREEVLAISWLNEETGVWVRVPSSDLNKTANTITAKLRHFSVYGVIGAPSMNLSGAYAYPVPFMPSKGHRFITFTNLSSLANIRIYTANGELVRELHESDGDGTLSWDVTNSDGDPLGSDVFIYVIKNDEQKKIGKLMVVR